MNGERRTNQRKIPWDIFYVLFHNFHIRNSCPKHFLDMVATDFYRPTKFHLISTMSYEKYTYAHDIPPCLIGHGTRKILVLFHKNLDFSGSWNF